MECPDRKLLARFLDGEEVEAGAELRRHIESCPRCGEAARRHARMGTALKSALDARAQSMVKESIPCPSAEDLALYVEGNVPLYRKKQLLQHFCACPTCARAVLDAARSSGGSPTPLPQSLVQEAQAVYGGINPKSPACAEASAGRQIPRLRQGFGGQANPPPAPRLRRAGKPQIPNSEEKSSAKGGSQPAS